MRFTTVTFYFFICSLLVLNFCFSQEVKKDSASYYKEKYKNSNQTVEQRISFAEKTKSFITSNNIKDLLEVNRDLAYLYLSVGNYKLFEKESAINIKLALKQNDSTALGYIYKNLSYYHYQVLDNNKTSYKYLLKSLNYFSSKIKRIDKAEILMSIATIQDSEKDYLGSEQNAIESLKIYLSLEEEKSYEKYLLYNLLGSVTYKLNEFDKSIKYNTLALDYAKRLKDYDLELESLNNLALPYNGKKQYEKSIKIYKSLVDNPYLKSSDIVFYALVLDNYTYSRFLSGDYSFKTLETDFKKALKLSDSLQDSYTKLAVSIDMAKFYKHHNQLDLAKKYAADSYAISKKISVNHLYLESMLLLADLTSNDESDTYYLQYIKLNDSLIDVERNVRNKFARLRFETDEIQQENEIISKKNLYLIIVSATLTLLVFLIYFYFHVKTKNRKIKLIQIQQKANEDIYNVLLNQQNSIDAARLEEKNRISKELHDDVLGHLFGVRFSLDSVNMLDTNEAKTLRSKYINQLKSLEDSIRNISHKLNAGIDQDSNFGQLIDELIKEKSNIFNLKIDLHYKNHINWEKLSNKHKINIYRILQESIQNIFKHAKAKDVRIEFCIVGDLLNFIIIDDGVGFNVNKSAKGIGLKNIKSRVKEMLGEIKYNSSIGNGTKLEISIPFKS